MTNTVPAYPSPRKILTADFLLQIWRLSKDAQHGSKKAAGIDKITPIKYQEELHRNLDDLSRSLKDGTFDFQKLKASLIDKGNGKKRVICVPSVSDRLVQRAILNYLTYNPQDRVERDLLKATTSISYGVRRGAETGVKQAIKNAIAHRNQKPWVLKTDISGFFDNIPRAYLKQLIRKRLGRHSLVPLLEKVIDSEIKASNKNEDNTIKSNGIIPNRGLRQGMPLSPLLSNLVLNKLDKKIIRKDYLCIRYVDDLIFFCETREECEAIERFIRTELRTIEQNIPHLGTQHSKTQIKAPDESVEFLGCEIYKQPNGNYAQRVPENSMNGAYQNLEQMGSIHYCREEKINYGEFNKRLSDKIAGYRASYKDCTNIDTFIRNLESQASRTKRELLHEIMGEEVYNQIPAENRDLLGINI